MSDLSLQSSDAKTGAFLEFGRILKEQHLQCHTYRTRAEMFLDIIHQPREKAENVFLPSGKKNPLKHIPAHILYLVTQKGTMKHAYSIKFSIKTNKKTHRLSKSARKPQMHFSKIGIYYRIN